MINWFLNRLFGSEICSQRAKDDDVRKASEVEVNVEKQPEMIKRYDDPDLNILAERYGELEVGKVITIELNEAAILLGRKRIKLDAFSSLIKKLHNEYGVELKIYSRRTKLEKKGNNE